MSVSLVLACPVHGADIEPFEVAGTKFCSFCVRDFFLSAEKWPVHELKMTEVEVKPREERTSDVHVCNRCDRVWPASKGRACPQCGLEAGEVG